MKKITLDLKYLIVVWGLLLIAITVTYAHHGNVLIDCGREVYYPTQILVGKILYKDLFNIYGPFAYMLNALFFKLFGINLNVLYIAGAFCSFLIVSLTYLIAEKFLSKNLSFAIAVLTISVGVLNVNLFNFIFPYSYGILYGIVAFLLSFLMLLKYQEKPERNLYFYLCCFFAGLCIISKYEFLPYLAVIVYAMLKIKRLNFKQYYFSIFSLLFAPVFCFGVLFLQGLQFSDLVNAVSILRKLSSTQTLKYFYTSQGVYFTKYTISFLFLTFLKTLIPLAIFMYGVKNIKKKSAIVCIPISLTLTILTSNQVTFAFLPALIIILSIINYKKLIKNTPLLFLAMSSIALSLKVIWGLATLNYGVFFLNFLLITIFAIIIKIFEEKNININQNALSIYMLVLAIVLSWANLISLSHKQNLIKTNKGSIYTYKYASFATEDLIEYINKNTKKTDTIVIFPEGQLINVLTSRKTDDYYNSLIPLYLETFGEKNIIEHFKQTKPEYVIFNNWNTRDYYFNYICTDYAQAFCDYVARNYSRQKTIDKGLRYLIYKRK